MGWELAFPPSLRVRVREVLCRAMQTFDMNISEVLNIDIEKAKSKHYLALF